MHRGFMRSLSLRRLVLIAAATFALCARAGLAQSDPTLEHTTWLRGVLARDLDDYLKTRSGAEHLSSLSLAVSLNRNQPPLLITAGTTKYHGVDAIVPTSLYQIGSNTKAFTAIAILQLEAQGRLSIDAPIGNYLPQYPAYRALTLRRLLNMTSGLESYDNTPQWERSYTNRPYANVSADSLIRLVYPNIKYRPGSRYFYSNTGYLLAQMVVDARSPSHSYDSELTRIFASVGLPNTFYTSNRYPYPVAERVVAGYYENDDAYFGRFLGLDMSGFSLSWAQGAGAIVSTPQDLTRWVRALYQGVRLLPQKQKYELKSLISLKTARPLRVPTIDDPAGFGLGVAERFDPKLGTFWFYQGETLGFRAVHLYFPASDLVVSLFANSRPVESNSKIASLFNTIYDHIMTKAGSSR
jgi:D-alanyl-D-alanine carboxypeptidase